LMDDIILKQSRKNKTANENAFFIKGTPKAILMVEFAEQSQQAILQKAKALKKAMKDAGYGYHFPVLWANDINKAWDLRKAGLGLMSNTPGDKKPASVIEDTAVRPEDLPAYMHDFDRLLKNHGLSCVKYAHISTGELHLRPVLNLKTEEGNKMFRTIARETAKLVKKYRGSLSGEHGDGRLRGEFIPLMIGDKNFELIKSVKKSWDPENIFNPGKITDTPAMNKSLRYKPGQENKTIPTIFDFSADQGFLRAAEKCTGSGDCRKPASMGGTMCPSYQATKDEYSSTRARANILREYITQGKSDNVFGHEEIKDVLDLCLSCKACKSECPAGVDITKLKAEAMQHYYDIHGVPLRSRLIANIYKLNRLGIIFPQLTNFLFKNKFISGLLKKATGFAVERSLPLVYNYSFKAWAKQNLHKIQPQNPIGELNIFNDEFTNYNDVETGMATVKLLCKLNYKVCLPKHTVSGRTFLSKGLLRKAKKIAVQNIEFLQHEVNSNRPLVGIEPSAILTFRDEYTDFFKPGSSTAKQADELSANCYTIEEFLSKEIDKGKITSESFTEKEKIIKFHGHCYQKALSSTKHTKKILELPKNFSVSEIDSGCCGMAGAFGYEKEHYRLSQKVGELSLFPAIKNSSAETIISAAGTSCRHQIKDGTTQEAKHPVQILYESLK
ncbi:MAG: FAD-linked oxidase C-terminal domain-containing protein, partial [Bacteroidota bacterium]|nr:FAD-linked oxidase C-terminal domain-containing protein [Bacteroidota bacterium]